VTYPLRFELFADDMERIAKARGAGGVWSGGRGVRRGWRAGGGGRRLRSGRRCGGQQLRAQAPPSALAAAATPLIPKPQPRSLSPQANFIVSMFYGFRILAAMMETVIGNEKLLGELRWGALAGVRCPHRL
jgi:hypothetical protein